MPSYTYKDSQARKPFEEPGDYLCQIEDFEFKFSSNGNEMLVLKIRTQNGALIYDNLIFVDKAMWKIDHALKSFLPSMGKEPPAKDENFEIDEDYVRENLMGASGLVRLIKHTDPTSGKTYNRVDQYLEPKSTGGKPAQGTTTKPGPTAPPTSAKPAPKVKPQVKEEDDDEIPF